MNITLPARKWLVAGAAVAGLQTAAIGWMVWDRIQLLRTGREIVLPIVPVDPRSLFRGDYVILSYDAQRIPAAIIPSDLAKARPSVFYVTLGKEGDVWKPVAMSDRPSPQTADRITLKARSRFGYWPQPVETKAETAPSSGNVATPARPPRPQPEMQVRYGIESYFVAEGKGRPLEDTARERKLAAVVAVDGKGNAAIKRLLIDGVRLYEEPLL